MLRIKRASGGVKMMDARGHDSRIKWLSESGYDLNQGMVYVSGGQIYFGADAISALAAISTPSDLFNKINHHILQNKTLSKIIYPVLKSGRNLTLMLLGRDPIKSN